MKIKNIIFIICLLVTLLASLNTISYADKFNPNIYKPGSLDVETGGKATELGKKIIGGITAVGIVISVVSTMALGIKYMAGSIEERAEYKKSMMPMLLGMILLFGVSWMIQLIYNVVSKINV